MTTYETFRHLHYQDKPLILGNAWNAFSAQLLEKNGFQAIATSSGAIAQTLGFDDGEKTSFEDLMFVVKKMAAVINVPFTVDLERGYGPEVSKISNNIERLHEAGVVGINIEDSYWENGKRQLVPADIFGKKLADIKTHLFKKNINFFINARIDTFLLKLPNAVDTTLERIRIYESSGADGIFTPFVREEEPIRQITSSTSLPINVVSMPGLPGFDKLTEWGVRRISLGSSLFRASYKNTELLIQSLNASQSVSGLN